MSDLPPAAEMPVKPSLKDLTKPAEVPPKPNAPEAPPAPASPADARKTLEEIAAGPEKEKMDKLLTQGAQLLLAADDPRVAIVAVARAAATTPLGTELRRDVLHMIAETDGESFSAIKKDIDALNLPKTDPAKSEFAKFLEDYSREHPDKAIDPSKIEALRTGKQNAAAIITQELQRDTGLAARLWDQLKGSDSHVPPNVISPEGLLAAAGLESTPENTAKARRLYEPKGPHPVMKLLQEIKSDLPSLMMTAGIITMVVTQFISQEGGGGHQ